MDAFSLPYKRIILVCLSLLILGVLSYNFKIGNEQRFDAYGDAREYIALGTSLAKTGSYGLLDISNKKLLEDFKEDKVSQSTYKFKRYSTWRPPVWPYIIALVFTLTGYSLTSLLAFKMLLLIFGAYVFYKTLKSLRFSSWITLLGVVLYLLHPSSQLYSRFFLSEPITLFFVTVFLFLAVRLWMGKGAFWSIGLVGGLLILCHPYLIFLPFCLYLFLFLYKSLSLKQVGICTMMTIGVVSLWVIRNGQVLNTHKPVITTSSGAVMAKGWNKEVVEKHTNTQGDLADEALVLEGLEYDASISRDEVAQSSLYGTAVFHFIKTHPDQILPIILTKLRSAFNPIAETSKPGFLETGRVIFHVLALIALLYALVFSKFRLNKVIAWALVLATIGIAIITYSGFRFRMPQLVLELFLIIGVLQELLGYGKLRDAGKNLL